MRMLTTTTAIDQQMTPILAVENFRQINFSKTHKIAINIHLNPNLGGILHWYFYLFISVGRESCIDDSRK
jgi:hypothetical protein